MADGNVKSALRKLTGRVMGRPGVTGTAVGSKGGRTCLVVYLAEPKAGRQVPKRVDGFDVVTEVTGAFRRL